MNRRILPTLFFITVNLSFNSCEFVIHRMNNPKPISKDNAKLNPEFLSKESGKIQIIAIGDWGEKGEFYQKQVARAMQKKVTEEQVDFILTTGDNFYESGVKNLTDSHFKKSFEEVYVFPKPIPWYITLGNHDYLGDVQSLLDYGELNPNWILPKPYYSFEKNISNSEKVLFLIADTNEFIHILNIIYYRNYMKIEKGKSQLEWMEKTLKENSSKWKIVVGHHPIYSAGEHGDTKTLQSKFLETLERNQVDIYISGHEHDLQHLKHPQKKIHFLISGSGSKVRELRTSPYSIFGLAEPGFLILTIEPKNIIVRLINKENRVVYAAKINKE